MSEPLRIKAVRQRPARACRVDRASAAASQNGNMRGEASHGIKVDLPSSVPVTARELDVLERYLGPALDALLGS